jgi:hypothetical protein
MCARPAGSAAPAGVIFFLNVDDRFGAVELLLQAFDLAAQLCIFERERIGLDPTLFRRQSIQDALGALTSPRCEV